MHRDIPRHRDESFRDSGSQWTLVVPGAAPRWPFEALFVGFPVALAMSLRRADDTGIAAQTVLVVSTVEPLHYGMVPNGLPIVMVAAALALRGTDQAAPSIPPTARLGAPVSQW